MLVINFYGGPGAGKSTMAASLFVKLKNLGYKAELSREVAREWIYEGKEIQLERNQPLLTATQYGRLKDLRANQCDIAISDSPLQLGKVYCSNADLHAMIDQRDAEFENINVFVTRTKPYVKFGRIQDDVDAARAIDELVKKLDIKFDYEVTGDEAGQRTIGNIIAGVLARRDGVQSAEDRKSRFDLYQ